MDLLIIVLTLTQFFSVDSNKHKFHPYFDAVDHSARGLSDNPNRIFETNYPGNINWSWVNFNTEPGRQLLDAADFDGDASIEVIFTDFVQTSPGSAEHIKTIYIMEDDLVTTQCMVDFYLDGDYSNQIFDHELTQLDQDEAIEVIIATKKGTMALDGKTCKILSFHEYPLTDISTAAIGDLNNDGVFEIVYSDEINTYISTWNDFQNVTTLQNLRATYINVDNLDRVDGEDIGIAYNDFNNGVLNVVNGKSLEVIGTLEAGLFSDGFVFSDINGDGTKEIVSNQWNNSRIGVFEIANGTKLFELNFNFYNTRIIKTYNIDGDGDDEIVVGYKNSPTFMIFDETGEIINQINTSTSGVSNLIITNLQNGNGNELLISTGVGSTESDKLIKATINDQSINWISKSYYNSYQISTPAQIYNDDRLYIPASFYRSSDFGEGGISILDSSTGSIKDIFEGTTFASLTFSIDSANIDSDPQLEVCHGNGYLDVFFTCIDPLTYEVDLNIKVGHNYQEYPYYAKFIDLMGDARKEILIINANGSVKSYNSLNGSLIWETEYLAPDRVSWGFNSVSKIEDVLWITFPNQKGSDVYQFNVNNGQVINSFPNSPVIHVAGHNDVLYAIRKDEGVGIIDTNTLEFDEMIYPSIESLKYLKVSDNGQIIMAASGNLPVLEPVLISTANEFEPWDMVDLAMYDAEFEGSESLYIATMHGVKKVGLEFLFENIFKNGFEL